MITPAEDRNNLFFNPEKSYVDLQMEKYDKEKKVVFENTRFEAGEKVLEFGVGSRERAMGMMEYVQDGKMLATPLLQGIED